MTMTRLKTTTTLLSVLTICLLSGYGSYAWSESASINELDSKQCVALGDWVVPGARKGSGKSSQQAVIANAVKAAVVLLGETHINADHHRWQLQTLAALHAQRPDMVIGFEMFPRRIQPILDRWIAGELNEKSFCVLRNGIACGIPMLIYICHYFILPV